MPCYNQAISELSIHNLAVDWHSLRVNFAWESHRISLHPRMNTEDQLDEEQGICLHARRGKATNTNIQTDAATEEMRRGEEGLNAFH